MIIRVKFKFQIAFSLTKAKPCIAIWRLYTFNRFELPSLDFFKPINALNQYPEPIPDSESLSPI